jgi:hypothetical protein
MPLLPLLILTNSFLHFMSSLSSVKVQESNGDRSAIIHDRRETELSNSALGVLVHSWRKGLHLS